MKGDKLLRVHMAFIRRLFGCFRSLPFLLQMNSVPSRRTTRKGPYLYKTHCILTRWCSAKDRERGGRCLVTSVRSDDVHASCWPLLAEHWQRQSYQYLAFACATSRWLAVGMGTRTCLLNGINVVPSSHKMEGRPHFQIAQSCQDEASNASSTMCGAWHATSWPSSHWDQGRTSLCLRLY